MPDPTGCDEVVVARVRFLAFGVYTVTTEEVWVLRGEDATLTVGIAEIIFKPNQTTQTREFVNGRLGQAVRDAERGGLREKLPCRSTPFSRRSSSTPRSPSGPRPDCFLLRLGLLKADYVGFELVEEGRKQPFLRDRTDSIDVSRRDKAHVENVAIRCALS